VREVDAHVADRAERGEEVLGCLYQVHVETEGV